MPVLPAILGGSALFQEPCHLVRPELPDVAELVKGFNDLAASRMLSNQGAFAKEFERRIASELDVEHCALFCNGTTAIMCLVQALDLQGEVIVPSFTFAATALALSWRGITPRFVDIDPRTLLLDPRKVEEAITPATAAILAVNTFGRCCDVDAFRALADKHGLPLIYDSAQAFGTKYRGKPVGGFGDAEALSFHATKVLHTAEGGAVVTNRHDLYERLCRIRNFGFGTYLNSVELGINGKLDELSAMVGLRLLDDLPKHAAARKRACLEYERHLEGIPGLRLPEVDAEVTPSHPYFLVAIDEKEFGLDSLELNYALMADRIVTRCYFYPPVHQTTYFRELLGNDVQGVRSGPSRRR